MTPKTTNLELSKKLKELGIKQESLWWWEEHNIYLDNRESGWSWRLEIDRFHHTEGLRNYCSALTVAELGEALPDGVANSFIPFLQGLESQDLYYEFCNIDRVLWNPNFLAKVYIYLVNEGLLK